MNYETILRNFQRGLWTTQMVHMAVIKGIITEEEYESIIENRPINFTDLVENINGLSSILESADNSMIQGVESIG